MHEIYVLKLGDRIGDSSGLLYGVDPGKKITIAYYMSCIKGPSGNILIDTGMVESDMKKRSLTNVKSPESLLSKIGVKPADIKTVIVTHLHSDHFSAYDLYPNATFYVQRKDLEFFATVDPKNQVVIKPVSDIAAVVRLHYAGRIKLLDGEAEIAPGIRVYLVGGHTPGSQVITVDTNQGTAVMCGDTVDLYRNLELNLHGGPTLDIIGAYAAYDKIRQLGSSSNLIVPGHEPLVMERFKSVGDGIVKIG